MVKQNLALRPSLKMRVESLLKGKLTKEHVYDTIEFKSKSILNLLHVNLYHPMPSPSFYTLWKRKKV
jgi:hypothetical protein